MITLDLFPKKEKKRLNFKRYYFLIQRISILFSAVAVLTSIVLFASKYIIKYDLDNITEQSATIVKSYKDLNQDIKNSNIQLKRLHNIQKENIEFSQILLKITDLIPKEITINSLSLNIEGDNVKKKILSFSLKGVAETRDDLIVFKDSLNSNDFIETVEFPITNLLKQESVEFEILTNLHYE
ncbi:hypothetical protein HOD96_02865 [Candidatus Falkowbacteria bacterium]|jgi:hypothetical protein|nr:hypothetical protein [Candidatus Falkowbacteria bacterium]